MDCNHNVERIPDISSLQEGMCPVDWALRCIEAACQFNCGRSVMCRDGMAQLRLIVNDIVSGAGQNDDVPLVRELCEVIASTDGCALGRKTAENVLYTLNQYGDEWDAHCRRKRCTAMVCKAYFSVYCDPAKCQGCAACIKACPAGAISGGEGLICVVDEQKCIRCGKCFEVCPQAARGKYGAVRPPRLPEIPVPIGSVEAAPAARRRRRH